MGDTAVAVRDLFLELLRATGWLTRERRAWVTQSQPTAGGGGNGGGGGGGGSD